MKINVVYEATEWVAEWFDDPWYFQCLHPETTEEEYLTFDGEVRTATVCADEDCSEEIE